jgi:hypothetical protein
MIRCRECEDCKDEPFADEDTGFEGWAFECKSPLLDKRKHTGWIGAGLDESDALPKTSPRWCPRRARKEQK